MYVNEVNKKVKKLRVKCHLTTQKNLIEITKGSVQFWVVMGDQRRAAFAAGTLLATEAEWTFENAQLHNARSKQT